MLTTNQLTPFFQVTIYEVEGEFNLIDLIEAFEPGVSEESGLKHYHMRIVDVIEREDNLYVVHLLHKFFPSWYIGVDVTKHDALEAVENLENDLLILYKKDNYLFIHSQCSVVLTIVDKAIDEIMENFELRFIQLKAKKMQTILNGYQIQYRTLALTNVFNAGGTAPESKSYYGKDTVYCLSPSLDTGFGFTYCLGTYKDGSNEYHPFGVSSKKSKVWRTWVRDIDHFIENCDEIIEMINVNSGINNLRLLVAPVESPNMSEVEVLHFYLDYNTEKGIVYLIQNNPEHDWTCGLDQITANKIVFTINENSVDHSLIYKIKINFEYQENDESYLFSYDNDDLTLGLLISDKIENLHKKRKTDLVEYLNKQRNFTFLMNNGIAYRNNSFWKDNRFTNQYLKVKTDISWDNVDIRREDRAPRSSNQINILTRLQNFLKAELDPACEIIINDNGSDEIADLIGINNETIILIHAKYSSEDEAGLRVDDIQVVCTQVLKNLKYFNYSNYKGKESRLHENLYFPNKEDVSIETLTQKLANALNNPRIKRECWIVQPGLKKSRLISPSESGNKIHVLLNYLDSICTTNNVQFKCYGSE